MNGAYALETRAGPSLRDTAITSLTSCSILAASQVHFLLHCQRAHHKALGTCFACKVFSSLFEEFLHAHTIRQG